MSAWWRISSAPLDLKFLAAPALANPIVMMPSCRSLTWAFWLSSSQENRRMVLTRSSTPGHSRRASTRVSPEDGSRAGACARLLPAGAEAGAAVGGAAGAWASPRRLDV